MMFDWLKRLFVPTVKKQTGYKVNFSTTSIICVEVMAENEYEAKKIGIEKVKKEIRESHDYRFGARRLLTECSSKNTIHKVKLR